MCQEKPIFIDQYIVQLSYIVIAVRSSCLSRWMDGSIYNTYNGRGNKNFSWLGPTRERYTSRGYPVTNSIGCDVTI